MNHHRIRGKFHKDTEPAQEDREVLVRYLSGANWKNRKYEGMRGKKGHERRSKRPKIRVMTMVQYLIKARDIKGLGPHLLNNFLAARGVTTVEELKRV